MEKNQIWISFNLVKLDFISESLHHTHTHLPILLSSNKDLMSAILSRAWRRILRNTNKHVNKEQHEYLLEPWTEITYMWSGSLKTKWQKHSRTNLNHLEGLDLLDPPFKHCKYRSTSQTDEEHECLLKNCILYIYNPEYLMSVCLL